MARPEKTTVDFFPFLCKEGKGMFYIENKYGNDGYATWIKILRQLAISENHWLDLSDPTQLMFISAKCKVSEDKLKEIVSDLCTLGELNATLWNENKIVYCQKFIDNIQEAYKKRTNDCVTFDSLLQHLYSLGVRKPDKCTLKGSGNTDIRQDNIRSDEIILEDKKEKRKNHPPPDFSKIPLPFNSPEFIAKWNEWLQYRVEVKKPYKSEKSVAAVLEALGKYSAEFAIILINRSMSGGWQGLIFEKTDSEYEAFKIESRTKGSNTSSGFGGL